MNATQLRLPRLGKLMFVTLLPFLAIACSSDDDDGGGGGGGDPTLDAYALQASGSAEIPSNSSTATAQGSLTLNPDDGAFSGSLTSTGINATAAHIHEAFAGGNGDVIVTLDIAGDQISVPDGTLLNSAQMSALAAGRYYLNIHSAATPAGELRAQLIAGDISLITTALSGAQEVPANASTGTGTGYLTLNQASGELFIALSTNGLSTTVSAAHLHGEHAGRNGGVIVNMTAFDGGDSFALSTAQRDQLLAGGTYLNVHTQGVPAGELRGQVLPAGIDLYINDLTGDQQVPAVTTAATARGAVTVNRNSNSLTAVINTSGLAGTAQLAHVHAGATGVNGSVITQLTQDTGDATIWQVVDTAISAADITAISNGGSYLNVHTSTFAAGELRAQIQ